MSDFARVLVMTLMSLVALIVAGYALSLALTVFELLIFAPPFGLIFLVAVFGALALSVAGLVSGWSALISHQDWRFLKAAAPLIGVSVLLALLILAVG